MYGTVSCWLWTNREYVGIGVCLNLIVSLFFDTTTSADLHTCMLSKYTTMAKTHGWLCVDVDNDWMYGTVSCWLRTSRAYVAISTCLNLNVLLLGIQCTMTTWQLQTPLLFQNLILTKPQPYTTMTMAHDSVPMLIEYMEWHYICWLQIVRWY